MTPTLAKRAPKSEPLAILVAEDSELDRMLLHEAFEELDFHVILTFVGDGEALLEHLRRRAPSSNNPPSNVPYSNGPSSNNRGGNDPSSNNRAGSDRPAADEQPARLPTLVLMDLNMPRMKGIDALIELRADVLLRALPVIALSTSNNPMQIARAYACGVNAYLTKPEQFGDFVELLKSFGSFWLQKAKLPVVLADL